MAKVHPSWKKSGSHFEQEYGFHEALYSKIAVPPGERGLFLIGASVNFKYNGTKEDLAPRFRQAWIQMRHRHPALAATTSDRGKVYKSPSEQELNWWADKTFRVQNNTTGSEVFSELTKTEYVTLRYLPESSELFLQAEHHHLDGGGVMHFWDQFFEALIAPQEVVFGEEIQRLPPRSDDLVDIRESSPGRGKDLAISMLHPLSFGEPISMPVDINATPARNFRLELKLEVRTTSAIIKACKAKDLTVTAVWHTAVALATQEFQIAAGIIPGTKFTSFPNFNIRPYFPRTADPELYKVTNYHTILPLAVEPAGKSFYELARQLTAFYRKGLSDPPDIFSALKPMLEVITPLFTSGQMTDSTPAVSSLGIVDPFIKRAYGWEWEIEDVWFGDTVTGPWIEGFLWSWKDKLVLGSCYNSGFYTPAGVEAFHEMVAEIMLEGLGLQSSMSRI